MPNISWEVAHPKTGRERKRKIGQRQSGGNIKLIREGIQEG